MVFMAVAMRGFVVVAMPVLVLMVMVLVIPVMVVVMRVALPCPAVQIGHVVVVVLVRSVQYYVKIAGIQSGFFHAADVDAKPVQRQTCQRLAQHGFARAQVQQRRRDHIAADAGVAFQVQGTLFLVHTLFLFRAQGKAVDLGS